MTPRSRSLLPLLCALLVATPLPAAAETAPARARALASADFDEDGVPDLVTGYDTGSGGAVTIRRGNVDAIYPNAPEAQARRAAGTFTDAPFLAETTTAELPAAADFVAAGDFDADGHWDVATAARDGETLYWLRGTGGGGLEPATARPLPGRVTALASGEVNRRDGLADIAVAVSGPGGAAALVFEGPDGALRSEPEIVPLPAEATGLSLGQAAGDFAMDLTAIAGGDLIVVEGRDRRLSLGEAQRASVAAPAVAHVGPAPAARKDGPVAALPMRLSPRAGADVVVVDHDGVVRVARVRGSGTFTVTSTADEGAGSLRQAIHDANTAGGGDIEFDISGSGVQTITAASELPIASVPVTIDGTTQRGYRGAPVVELVGSNIRLTGGSSVVRGLAIGGAAGTGVAIEAGDGNVVEGNYIGTDATGTIARGNSGGGVSALSSGNTIGGTTANGRNVISASIQNSGVGVFGSSNAVVGNYIGADASGAVNLGNDQVGIFFAAGGSDNTLGGATAGARNVISGNSSANVLVSSNATGTVIQGNYIGPNAAGTAGLGGGLGIALQAPGNTVGGTTPAARNIVAGNGSTGVSAAFAGSDGNVIQGNFIGAGPGGAPLPNGQSGIAIREGANDTTIGGGSAAAANVIAFNTFSGVTIAEECSGNTIARNRIFDNAVLGIDLSVVVDEVFTREPTPNDPGDFDEGPNGFQNFPVITSVTASFNSTVIEGVLDSQPSSAYTIDLYSTEPDPTGFGEGAIYLGATEVATDASGHADFSLTLAAGAGEAVTATATDAAGSTSEFSRAAAPSTFMLDWDEPDPNAGMLAPPRNLTATPGTEGPPARVAQPAPGVTSYKVYRSTTPNVQPTPANFFTSVPPTQTSTNAPVEPGGSFFVVTATYEEGESAPSNEAGADPPAGPTIASVKVTASKIAAKGTGFDATVQVFVDGLPFVAPAKVKRDTKVTQKGRLLTGQGIFELIAPGGSARIVFRNADGGSTTFDYTRP